MSYLFEPRSIATGPSELGCLKILLPCKSRLSQLFAALASSPPSPVTLRFLASYLTITTTTKRSHKPTQSRLQEVVPLDARCLVAGTSHVDGFPARAEEAKRPLKRQRRGKCEPEGAPEDLAARHRNRGKAKKIGRSLGFLVGRSVACQG